MPRLRSAGFLRSAAGVLVVLVACKGSEPAASGGTSEAGGTVVIATAADAGTMLPPLIASNEDRQITDLLYDRLAEIGNDLNTVGDKGFTPRLAERWEWAPDSLSIIFHINPHAKWHDGQPVRASDVRYTVALDKDPLLGSPVTSTITNVDSVSVRDSLTAVAWFKKHVPEQFYDLVYQVAILPEHLLSNTPAAKLKGSEISRRGIGSGQFRLGRWDAGSRIELLADTANYRGRPKLDRVVFSIAPDFNGASARFFAGDADVFENIRPEQVTKLASDTSRRALRLPSLGFNYMAMNAMDPKAPGHPHPIFGDRNVRRALTMAVDRRALLKNVFDSLGQMLYGPFPHLLAVADTTLPQIPYDTAHAKALLDSAGWTVGADGVRAKGGRRLAFSITTPNSSAARRSYSVLLQDAFRRVGADVKVDEVDFPAYMQKLNTHAFDVEMASFSPDPSVSGFKQIFATSGSGPDGQNQYSYSNPVVDALLDSATTSFDPARTKAYARRAFETIIEDAPAIWLYELPAMAGIQKRIHVGTLRPDQYFVDLGNWSIPAGQRNARDKIGLRPAP